MTIIPQQLTRSFDPFSISKTTTLPLFSADYSKRFSTTGSLFWKSQVFVRVTTLSGLDANWSSSLFWAWTCAGNGAGKIARIELDVMAMASKF
jgi:hypothetical protein